MERIECCARVAGALVLTVLLSSGCSNSPPLTGEGRVPLERTDTVRETPLFQERIFLYKTNTLPSGDIIKRWHWDQPWEIRTADGTVLRRMYSPEWSPDATNTGGPYITVIQDPHRGTIYEAFFVQKTEAVFDLPMTLHFFATRESPSPLFSLSFVDSSAKPCQTGRVSRGGIKSPLVPQTLFETAQWIGIGWQSTVYRSC